MNQTKTIPTWDQYKSFPRGRDHVAAVAVLEAEGGGQVLQDAGRWLFFSSQDTRCDEHGVVRSLPMMAWEGWVADVDKRGRGWSSSSHRIFQVAAALASDRSLHLPGNLDEMGSWTAEVWTILVRWGTGQPILPEAGRTAFG